MAGVNKVILVGNLGQDVELKQTDNNTAYANISVATSDTWTDKQGQKQERTEWHRVCLFGKLAEIAGQYLHKGSKVYVEGKLQTRKWQDQTGADRYTTEVVLSGFGSTLQMLDRRDGQQPHNAPPQQQSQPNAPQNNTPIEPVDNDDFDDDIPF